MIFVTGRNKSTIPNHFDKAYELETELNNRGKTATLEIVKSIIPPHITCVYIRQAEALGLGHAVLCAKPVVGNEPFAVILADDLIANPEQGCLGQMVDVFNRRGGSVLGVERVDPSETASYGIVKTSPVADGLGKIDQIVEKPAPESAPSNLGVVGRYVLTPKIFEKIEQTGKGAGGEIQLTDAIADLTEEEPVFAYEFKGRRYDCGSKLGYLEANVEYGLQHSEVKESFERYLKELVKS